MGITNIVPIDTGNKLNGQYVVRAWHNLPRAQVALLCLLFCLLTVASLLHSPIAHGEPNPAVTIYHYNPESHSGRSLVLKTTFDRYLQTTDNLQLQPVEDQQTFHRIISNAQTDLFIVSDWDFKRLSRKLPDLVPVLRGQKNASDEFLKFLVIHADNNLKNSGQRPTIAVSGSLEYTITLLGEMTFEGRFNPINNPRFLKVPKDIDALLSVSFGLADAALATESSVEKLSQLYQNEYQKMKVLGISRPQKHMVVVTQQQNLESLKWALDKLEAMDQSKEGRLGLNLLGLDSWQPLPSPDGRTTP